MIAQFWGTGSDLGKANTQKNLNQNEAIQLGCDLFTLKNTYFRKLLFPDLTI